MSKLSDIELRALVRAGKPVAGKTDAGGLTFTLSKAGTAAWVLRYRSGGKARELTLGRYPDLSLSDARKRAAKERTRISEGADPASEKRRARLARASARTFRELADDYLARRALKLSSTTRKETKRYLDKDILPRIGGLALSDVTGAEIVHLVETIAARSNSVARHALELVSTIFAHGVAKHLVKANPCADLKRASIIGTQSPRSRLKLSAGELRTLFANLHLLSPENALAIRLLLLTAVRKAELLAARWSEIDLDGATWTLPAERTKTRTGFTILLPHQAVAHFRSLKELAGDSEWVATAANTCVWQRGRPRQPFHAQRRAGSAQPEYGRPRELHVEHAVSVADCGPADLPDAPSRYTAERTILVVDRHLVLERIELSPNSTWDLCAGRELWLFAADGNARIGPLDISIADAVFAEAEQVPIKVGSSGLKALVAYPGPALAPGLLTELPVAGADSNGR